MSEYQLSAELCTDPLSPLRVLYSPTHNTLIAGSAEGMITRFTLQQEQSRDWSRQLLFGGVGIHGDRGLLMSICGSPRTSSVCYSGGSDGRVVQWDWTSAGGGHVIGQYEGHTGPVCSLDYHADVLVSGSFDQTARVWDMQGQVKSVLGGHPHGVQVLVVGGGGGDQVITASGNRNSGVIHWWNGQEKIRSIEQAHKHVVRKLARHPLGFVSCGNDGYVKLWTGEGQMVWQVLAHPAKGDTDSFVYGIAVFSNGDVVSVGEDANAQVISSNGEIIQTLKHPAPIRDVLVLQNGDFVTAGGDGLARVWTRDHSRALSQELQKAFHEYVEMAASAASPVLPEQCHPESALSQPGRRDGQVLVVDVRGKGPTVFQWRELQRKWEEIGAAVGKREKENAPAAEESKEFDHIVQIDLGPPYGQIPLGFNSDDDPEQAAIQFCERHKLESIHVPEIRDHLKKFADPEARARRIEAEKLADSKKLRTVPCWIFESFQMDTKAEFAKMESKLQEFQDALSSQNSTFALTALEMKSVSRIISMLKNSGSFHSENLLSVDMKQAAIKMLNWPIEFIFPVLDLYRVLFAHGSGVGIADDPFVQRRLLEILCLPNQKIPHLLIEKALTNWIAKRNRNADHFHHEFVQYIEHVLDILGNNANDSNSNSFNTFAQLVFNVISYFGRSQVSAPSVFVRAGKILVKLLQTPKKEKPLFFASITLATVLCDPSAKSVILPLHTAEILNVINILSSSNNSHLLDVSLDLKNICN